MQSVPLPDNSGFLLLALQPPGTDMSLKDFCVKYDLDDKICVKLTENAFKNSCFLHFLTLDDLCNMKFLYGEIAALHDALEMWSAALSAV